MKEGESHFDKLQQSAKRPNGVNQKEWQTGMAVVKTLFDLGEPTHRVKDSVCGPDFPNKYDVEGKTVEYMPHWKYYTIEENGKREHIPLPSSEVFQEQIVEDVRGKITSLQEKAN